VTTVHRMMELMGDFTTEAQAKAMIELLDSRGLTVDGMEDQAFFDMIPEAVERARMNELKRLREALGMAAEVVEIARRYFPKSMHNSDKFQLEQTSAAIHKATQGE
jgi:CTP synthase (UTP-ammonia lyase)